MVGNWKQSMPNSNFARTSSLRVRDLRRSGCGVGTKYSGDRSAFCLGFRNGVPGNQSGFPQIIGALYPSGCAKATDIMCLRGIVSHEDLGTTVLRKRDPD